MALRRRKEMTGSDEKKLRFRWETQAQTGRHDRKN